MPTARHQTQQCVCKNRTRNFQRDIANDHWAPTKEYSQDYLLKPQNDTEPIGRETVTWRETPRHQGAQLKKIYLHNGNGHSACRPRSDYVRHLKYFLVTLQAPPCNL